jgi:alpha-N-arabinofuranosidase
MYKVHHDATLLPIDLQTVDYSVGNDKLPALNASASKDKSGKIHISICNLDPNKPNKVDCELRGVEAKKVSGRVLTAPAMNSHNTFDRPNVVRPETFKEVSLRGGKLTATLPAKAVVVLEIE